MRRDYITIFAEIISSCRIEKGITRIIQECNLNLYTARDWLQKLVDCGLVVESYSLKKGHMIHTYSSTIKGLKFTSVVQSLYLELLPLNNQPESHIIVI